MDNYSTFNELTSIGSQNIEGCIFPFAKDLGWNPSYFLKADKTNESFANGFLTVEHGLENAALLAFLNKPYDDLKPAERKKLDSVAYNNLVSWLIPIDARKFYNINILNSPDKRIVKEQRIYDDDYDVLRYDAFLQITGKKQSPNYPELDDALIANISKWKCRISSQMPNLSNEPLSLLFNTIIFIRSIEDSNRRFKNINNVKPQLLSIAEDLNQNKKFSLSMVFEKAFEKIKQNPEFLSENKEFEALNGLSFSMVNRMFESFYETEDNRFSYDFSIMSKHALSRIYERYVSILYVAEELQPVLPLDVNKIPEERKSKNTGTYYTPEYIARFFAKYILKEFEYKEFNTLKIAEPSVGSGMFLRTLLEVYFESNHKNPDAADKKIFENILGVDVDANACLATKLSLSLLHYLLYDTLPKLGIVKEDSIDYFSNNKNLINSFDVVISNPPFVKNDNLQKESKDKLNNFLDIYAKGKPDLYLAFIKIAIDILRPGGLGLFVLPHSFLLNQSAEKIRKYLSENTNIKLIADLSAVPVFGDVGIYVILLIFQKKADWLSVENPVVLKCTNHLGKVVGDALENVLKLNNKTDDNYSIYAFEQKDFKRNEWYILPPKEYSIEKKLEQFPKIENYLEVRQGFITGADPIFIREKQDVPKGEEDIYIPYIHDKEMLDFTIPKQITQFVFYPYLNNEKITQEQIQSRFPKTWQYFLQHRKELENRYLGSLKWWMIKTPIIPEYLYQPKIITPYLSLMPRFSLDIIGKYAVSRSPYFILKKQEIISTESEEEFEDSGDNKELLYYFLGILNSIPCYWYIANHSLKYSSGYNKLEVYTLKNTPVPPPDEINTKDKMKLINLVKNRMEAKEKDIRTLEKEINKVACKLYGLTAEETSMLTGL